MRLLSNDNLIETYYKAIDLKLDHEFIRLLLKEINKRKLDLSQDCRGA